MTARQSKLYGPDGRKIQYQYVGVRHDNARRTGSMQNWRPSDSYDPEWDRNEIVRRSIDLAQSDSDAAGVLLTIATMTFGYGLNPQPHINYQALEIPKETAKKIQIKQANIFRKWSKSIKFGRKQNIAYKNVLKYGETLALLTMREKKPYQLSVRLINPRRLQTPSDVHDSNVFQGVTIDDDGEPVGYWIHNQSGLNSIRTTSKEFEWIPAKRGHRYQVLHYFVPDDTEEARGWPILSSALKKTFDKRDLLDAELVSSVVTSSHALAIETPGDPLDVADATTTVTETGTKSDGSEYDRRYEEVVPGSVMYLSTGQKANLLAPNRPGATFETFVKMIDMSIANGTGFPYPVAFKDFKGMNFASYRSALLEAWRVVTWRRSDFADNFLDPIYQMLMEEAFLKDEIPGISFDDFYENMYEYTTADWIGPPKGQIEPVKEAQANEKNIQNNLKTRAQCMIEDGKDPNTVFEAMAEEQELMEKLGLHEEKIEAPEPGQDQEEKDEEEEEKDNE